MHNSLLGRLARKPDSGHEVGLGRDGFKTGLPEPGIDVIADVVAVEGLMEHPPKILHHVTKLG